MTPAQKMELKRMTPTMWGILCGAREKGGSTPIVTNKYIHKPRSGGALLFWRCDDARY
jgi:hypothetical protein